MSSEPPSTYQHLPPLIHRGNAASTTTTAPVVYREYRKGNWTMEETLILITAKKLDDQRRSKPDPAIPRPTGELRWKWVENFCWNNGCLRSQNQCNDKWDNLLRDYKKVREYELRLAQSTNLPTYWALDKQQRKDHSLPSNLTQQIYQALQEVVQTKCSIKVLPPPATAQPPQIAIHPPPPPPPVASEGSESSETDWSGKLDSDTKRKRIRDIGSSIVHGASSLARALRNSEEKKEKRHREVMELEEQRRRVEESQNEAHKQGMASLVSAVNNLSGAIHSLISNPRPPQT